MNHEPIHGTETLLYSELQYLGGLCIALNRPWSAKSPNEIGKKSPNEIQTDDMTTK